MINNRSGISAYMLLDKYTTVGWIQGTDSNEIFQRIIKWGNPKFDQNTKYHGIWKYGVNYVNNKNEFPIRYVKHLMNTVLDRSHKRQPAKKDVILCDFCQKASSVDYFAYRNKIRKNSLLWTNIKIYNSTNGW